MSSRRRLDISSLLCDSNEANRTDAPVSRSLLEQLDAQQPLRRVPSSDYSSIDQGASTFSRATRSYESTQYGNIPQHQHRPELHQQGQEEGLMYLESVNASALPPTTDLVPLALQPSPPRRRTPSPPELPPSGSPNERTGRMHHSEGGQKVSPPRTKPATLQSLHEPEPEPEPEPETHPHRYSQFPLPPSSTSPVNIHHPSSHPTSVRRPSAQFSRPQYSPISLTHPSPSPSSLPINFSASACPLSLSPTDLSRPRRPSTSGSGNTPPSHSPVLPLQSEPRMYASHRTSASLSPSVPTSTLSGLDALVQAATEERERIDVNRRLSGGEEYRPLLNYAAPVRTSSLSPVEPRHDPLQGPPLTPPYSASSHVAGYFPGGQADAYYNAQILGENIRQRRSSPGPPHLHQLDVSQVSHHGATVLLPSPGRGFGRRSHSPEAAYTTHETQSHRPKNESRLLSPGTSRHASGSKIGPLYTAPSSARTVAQGTYDEDEEASTSTHFPHISSSVDPSVVHYVRRSPPRSRPKPKKPGSAALKSVETEYVETLGERPTNKHVKKPISPGSQSPEKVQDINARARQSNERGASDDEEVDDFFLSAFDSPRNTGRQIASQKSNTLDTSVQSIEDELSGHWSYAQSKRRNMPQSARSPTKLGSSPVQSSYYSSPVRDTIGQDDGRIMTDVEAEIFDELADAAGAVTSEAERTDFDDAETDNMEVDVENELLSLIDEPAESHSKSYHHSKAPTHSPSTSTAPYNEYFDRVPMPPPNGPNPPDPKARNTKKALAKPKTKGTKGLPGDATKSFKGPLNQIQESSENRSSKPKTSKSRPTKGLLAEKAKGTKASREPLTPTSATLPMVSDSNLNPSTPTGDAFPVVTSSGRMVTKSKKSAAASTNQPVVPHHRKKPPIPTGGDGDLSRSRSHSVMPRASVDPESHREKDGKEEEEKAKEKDAPIPEVDDMDKDKLYCICRTQYDEDKVMIACDRCDEWYHTQCVNMPDLLVDLVDQFICSNCIAQSPSLNLRTTYKQRCFSGLKHPNADSPDACHKPSRGAFSKYCSDECGVRHMHRKIQLWASNGGDVRSMWESVKDAKRREGFVTHKPGRNLPKAILAEIQNNGAPKLQGSGPETKQTIVDEEGRNSIIGRLEKQLQAVVQEREELKKQLEVLSWRERLLQLASDRAENVGDCGWDQRLVYGDEEWLEFGAGVLESYEDTAPNGHAEGHDMDIDGQAVVGEWWCRGKRKCERHSGWQRVRTADMEMERSSKEGALADLTTQEREIRSRVEDILHPQSRPAGPFPEATFKFMLASSEGGGKKSKKKTTAATAA